MRRRPIILGALLLGLLAPAGRADEDPLRTQAAEALRRAVAFFREQVAVEGGYLYRYSEDLSQREGEEQATATMAWIQPPGTPAVGMVYLSAFEATQDPYYLDAARETAHALVRGQLRSGGWDNSIEFDPRLRRRYAYRVDEDNEKGRNVTTLDDDKTQSALRLLMRVDRATDSQDRAIHDAVEYALAALLGAQYPNGAWPQRFDRPPDPARFPVKPASYPDSWARTFPKADYAAYYTLNDNTQADMIDVMLEASKTYDRPECRASAERGGGFLLLAQMPDPQPAWAQQYDAAMHPAWARKFEPPAVTGGESQGALRILLRLYRETGEDRFLGPIPRALEYLRSSRLPDGRLARFYELRTNRPLYFTKSYELTYDDSDMPTHYAFKVGDGTEAIAREYERLQKSGPDRGGEDEAPARPRPSQALEDRARAAIAALDDRGRWVEDGRLLAQGPDDPPVRRIIDCRTFIRNVEALARYLDATRP